MAESKAPERRGRGLAEGRAYAIGLLTLVLAAGCRLAFDPLTATKTAFVLLLGTVLTAAWYGGLLRGPGSTTLLAALVSDYLVVPADSSFAPGHMDPINLGLFLIEGSLISFLGSRLRASRRSEKALRNRAEDQRAGAPSGSSSRSSRPSTGSAWLSPVSSTWTSWSRP